ncbi:Delta(12) fatty acid desaturase [Turnera subulata]|uniref:Delta(12) fatty acid desaturase n=1 Tax=Turnera subulata TaxID=218843 RepID=A0A9Q0FJX2_9ROSI|nr:Delta(12) fatty acid desaturase [Turnera subulata]
MAAAAATASQKHDRFANHYDPYSPIFTDRERLQVVISDAGIFAALYVFYSVSKAHGFAWFFCTYLAPLLVVFALFIIITYLHHTNPTLPHYDNSEWEWFRGALSTIDLDFGWLNRVLHHVTNTHICHHLISTIPHYHSLEATEAIKPILGDYYQIDSTPIHKMLYRAAKECIYAEPDQDSKDQGVYWYRPYKHKI